MTFSLSFVCLLTKINVEEKSVADNKTFVIARDFKLNLRLNSIAYEMKLAETRESELHINVVRPVMRTDEENNIASSSYQTNFRRNEINAKPLIRKI